MTFNEWWNGLTKGERKVLGEGNARFIWEECEKHTSAKDEGDEVHIGGYTLQQGGRPGMIWISAASGEGGEFHLDELAQIIDRFFKEKF
jgi:hypothetical protein